MTEQEVRRRLYGEATGTVVRAPDGPGAAGEPWGAPRLGDDLWAALERDRSNSTDRAA